MTLPGAHWRKGPGGGPERPGDPRPLAHPLWPAFYLWVKTGGAKVNPKLPDTAAEFGIHGGLLWEAFVAGYEVRRAGAI